MYVKTIHGQYQSSWFDSVKKHLNCGFRNIWESQETFNSTLLNLKAKII